MSTHALAPYPFPKYKSLISANVALHYAILIFSYARFD